jgi:hypothetical protein
MNRNRIRWTHLPPALAGLGLLILWALPGAQEAAAPKFKFDPDWPKPLPNKWKLGGVTGLAMDKDDNVWVLDRPNDLPDIELEAELTPPLADCCVRPPAMIHFDKNGDVIGSFDAPQGHGMAVDSKGFVYIGQDTVRKYDPKTGKVVAEVPRTPERPPGGGGGSPAQIGQHPPGRGSADRGHGKNRRSPGHDRVAPDQVDRVPPLIFTEPPREPVKPFLAEGGW